jgi:hypothetical protein
MLRSLLFISYAQEDMEFALRLAQDLRARAAAVWVDQFPRPRSLDQWLERQSVMIDAGRFLVVLSPAALASEEVMSELSYAIEKSKKVLPALYQDCEIPLPLRRARQVDFRGEYAPALEQLVARIRKRRA